MHVPAVEQPPNRYIQNRHFHKTCLLYTSDAADELDGVDLGGRRIIKKKFFQAEDGIRDQPRSRGLGDVYKRQGPNLSDESISQSRMEGKDRLVFLQ